MSKKGKRNRARGWRNCGVYVWRGRKPSSFLGIGLRFWVPAAAGMAWWLWVAGRPGWWLVLAAPLLFSGRHILYVGMTGNRFFRDRQHLFGDSRYGAVGKPWSDLDPKVYPLPCLFPSWEWARSAQEKLYIWLLLPVYNVEWNTKNPRRIKPVAAQTQRWSRDKLGLKVNVGRAAARWALGGVLLAGVVWSAYGQMF